MPPLAMADRPGRHQQPCPVRIHAVGRKFANTAKLVRRIVYSDQARCIFEVAFGCIDEPAVRRNEPVAERNARPAALL